MADERDGTRRAIRAKQASSHDVVQAHLRRITEVNPAVNAVTVVLAERALDVAKVGPTVQPPAATNCRHCMASRSRSKGNIDLAGTRRRRD